jgi:hypothetical protein
VDVDVLDGFDRNEDDVMEAAIILEIWCHLFLNEVKPLLAPTHSPHLGDGYNELNNSQSFG